MRFPYLAPGRGLPTQTERAQILDQVNLRGAPSPPGMVRDVQVQPAPRGLLVNWALPGGDSSTVKEYRVYAGDETNLQQTITDRGTRQIVVPATAGTVQNVFVSAVDAHGNEGPKVQVQAKAITEAGAPAFPKLPVNYSIGSGSDKTDNNHARTILVS